MLADSANMREPKLFKDPITKERLKRYRHLVIETENQIERAARARAQLDARPSIISDMPHSNYAVDRMAIGVNRLIELEKARDDMIARMTAETEEIEKAISKLPDPRERELMRMKYFDGIPWERIAETFEMSRQWATQLHGRILIKLYNITCH